MIFCDGCGVVPVPEEDLPVELPPDLFEPADPERGYGLAHHPTFAEVPCPRCDRPARRETDTLDCYFDVIWCFLACATRLDEDFGFRPEDFHRWMPVDWFHNGMDSFFYAHLYRFLGRVLYDLGFLEEPEPMRRYQGHDAVLRDGKKMSKHHGNVVAPDEILDSHGADVLRVHVLWSANPLKSVEWSAEHLERARRFLLSVWELLVPSAGLIREGFQGWKLPPLQGAAGGLARFLRRTVDRVTVFLEDYRYNACLEELNVLVKRMRSFARQRFGELDDGGPEKVTPGEIGEGVSAEDAAVFAAAARSVVLQLAPFAPHLGEELWRRIGGEGLVATADWPPGPTLSTRTDGGR
jgi:leucyl-tRNA synthetase